MNNPYHNISLNQDVFLYDREERITSLLEEKLISYLTESRAIQYDRDFIKRKIQQDHQRILKIS
jgi:hypothetical protein